MILAEAVARLQTVPPIFLGACSRNPHPTRSKTRLPPGGVLEFQKIKGCGISLVSKEGLGLKGEFI